MMTNKMMSVLLFGCCLSLFMSGGPCLAESGEGQGFFNPIVDSRPEITQGGGSKSLVLDGHGNDRDGGDASGVSGHDAAPATPLAPVDHDLKDQ